MNLQVKNLKNIVKKLIVIILIILKKNINIDLCSNISVYTLKRLFKLKNKSFPINIEKSNLGDVNLGYGCKLYKCECGSNLNLGRFVSIWGPGTKISSDINGISIGSFSSIASNVTIQEHYHRYDKISTYFMSKNIFGETFNSDIYSKGKITIEEDVWIGSNTVILSGVRIGRGSIVGAGSVVTKDIPKYSIVVGNPGKVIGLRFSKEEQELLENSKWWEWEINEIIENKELFKMEVNFQVLRKLNKIY